MGQKLQTFKVSWEGEMVRDPAFACDTGLPITCDTDQHHQHYGWGGVSWGVLTFEATCRPAPARDLHHHHHGWVGVCKCSKLLADLHGAAGHHKIMQNLQGQLIESTCGKVHAPSLGFDITVPQEPRPRRTRITHVENVSPPTIKLRIF